MHHALRHVARQRNVQVLDVPGHIFVAITTWNGFVKYPYSKYSIRVQYWTCHHNRLQEDQILLTNVNKCEYVYVRRAVIRRLHNFVSLRLFPPNSVTLPPLFRTSWWIPCAVRVLALLCELYYWLIWFRVYFREYLTIYQTTITRSTIQTVHFKVLW